MKRIVLVILLLPVILLSYAQAPNPEIKLTDNYKVDTLLLDFTVPDLPAFKALGTNPSNILRPSDVQKFAVMLNPFFSNGQAVIPKSFALDFAPWKIASGKWTVDDYRNKKNWLKRLAYNSSFSIGTVQENKDFVKTKIAIGYRLKLFGKNADLLTSDSLPDVYKISDQELRNKVHSRDNWIKNIKKIDSLAFINDDNLQKAFDKYYEDSIKTNLVQKKISSFRKNNWNAARTDLALAVVGSSSDSLAENTMYESFQVWLTQSLRVGKWGQWLIGTSLSTSKAEGTDYTLNTRLYAGNNNVRAYGELQFKHDDMITSSVNSSLLNLGGEFRIEKRFWVDFYGGVENFNGTGDASRFRTSLSLKYSINK